MEKNKIGYTLIELLATIVILGIIATIAVPIVINTIKDTRMQAFKIGVYSVFDAYGYEEATQNYDEVGQLDISDLKLNNQRISIGTIKRNDIRQIEVISVSDGTYCANGIKEDLEIVEGDCSSLDETAPIINNVAIMKTTRSMNLIVSFSEAKSLIKSYEFRLLDENDIELIGWVRGDSLTGSGLKRITTKYYDDLEQDKTYKVQIKIVNNSGNLNDTVLREEIVKLDKINVPDITYDMTEYSLSKNVEITYDNNPSLIHSYMVVDKDLNVITEWTTIDSLSREIIISNYDYTVIAKSTDNVTEISNSKIIGYIDYTKPTVNVTEINNVWATSDEFTVNMEDNLSGIENWCITTYDNSDACEWVLIEPILQTSKKYTITSNGTYYAFAKDVVGNISEAQEFTISKVDTSSISTPTITTSDSITSNNWHTSSFTINTNGISSISGVTYYYGTNVNTESEGNVININNDTLGITYYVKACNGASTCGNNSSYIAKLDKVVPVVNITGVQNPNNRTLTANITSGSSVSGYTYQWYKDGAIIAGATSQTYTTSIGGSYTVRVNTVARDSNGITPIESSAYVINLYTINYNNNGGTGSPASQTKVEGINIGLSSTVPTRSGYSFLGWGTSANDTSVDYNSSATITTNTNLNLYAIWKKTVTITFNSNGATLGSTSVSCDIYNTDTSCSITSPTITRSGYTILGYNTTSSATTSTWSVSTAKNVSSNTTYYAITKKTVTITFNKNGATSQTVSGGSISTAATVTQSCTMFNAISSCSITSPSITGGVTPTVLGYNTTSSATSSVWNQNTAKSFSSNETYYAITRNDSKTYTITFNANGATLSYTSKACTIPAVYNGTTQATTCSVISPTITRSGYDAIGFNISSSATTSTWNQNTAANVSSNATYYAITKVSYYCPSGTLTYNSSYSSGTGGYICVSNNPSSSCDSWSYSLCNDTVYNATLSECPSGWSENGTSCTTAGTQVACNQISPQHATYVDAGGVCEHYATCVACAGENRAKSCMNTYCGGGWSNTNWSCDSSGNCVAWTSYRYTCPGSTAHQYSSTCTMSRTYSCPAGGSLSGSQCTIAGTYSCYPATCTGGYSYYCPFGWSYYSSSGSSMNCYKPASN